MVKTQTALGEIIPPFAHDVDQTPKQSNRICQVVNLRFFNPPTTAFVHTKGYVHNVYSAFTFFDVLTAENIALSAMNLTHKMWSQGA